jgi:hypothetical protein
MISDSNPVFVKIDKYKEILELITVIDKKIAGAKDILMELEELKQKEDEELSTWQKSLEEIDHKLQNIKDQIEP